MWAHIVQQQHPATTNSNSAGKISELGQGGETNDDAKAAEPTWNYPQKNARLEELASSVIEAPSTKLAFKHFTELFEKHDENDDDNRHKCGQAFIEHIHRNIEALLQDSTTAHSCRMQQPSSVHAHTIVSDSKGTTSFLRQSFKPEVNSSARRRIRTTLVSNSVGTPNQIQPSLVSDASPPLASSSPEKQETVSSTPLDPAASNGSSGNSRRGHSGHRDFMVAAMLKENVVSDISITSPGLKHSYRRLDHSHGSSAHHSNSSPNTLDEESQNKPVYRIASPDTFDRRIATGGSSRTRASTQGTSLRSELSPLPLGSPVPQEFGDNDRNTDSDFFRSPQLESPTPMKELNSTSSDQMSSDREMPQPMRLDFEGNNGNTHSEGHQNETHTVGNRGRHASSKIAEEVDQVRIRRLAQLYSWLVLRGVTTSLVGEFQTLSKALQIHPKSSMHAAGGSSSMTCLLTGSQAIFFACVAFSCLRDILAVLPKPTLRVLAAHPVIRVVSPDLVMILLRMLQNHENSSLKPRHEDGADFVDLGAEDIEKEEERERIEAVNIAQSEALNTSLPFQPRTDSRHRFRGQENAKLYSNREHVRDKFLTLIREFSDQERELNTSAFETFLKTFPERCRAIVASIKPQNVCWFSQFFLKQYLLLTSIVDGDVGADVVSNTRDAVKLKRLNARMTSGAGKETASSEFPTLGNAKTNNSKKKTNPPKKREQSSSATAASKDSRHPQQGYNSVGDLTNLISNLKSHFPGLQCAFAAFLSLADSHNLCQYLLTHIFRTMFHSCVCTAQYADTEYQKGLNSTRFSTSLVKKLVRNDEEGKEYENISDMLGTVRTVYGWVMRLRSFAKILGFIVSLPWTNVFHTEITSLVADEDSVTFRNLKSQLDNMLASASTNGTLLLTMPWQHELLKTLQFFRCQHVSVCKPLYDRAVIVRRTLLDSLKGESDPNHRDRCLNRGQLFLLMLSERVIRDFSACEGLSIPNRGNTIVERANDIPSVDSAQNIVGESMLLELIPEYSTFSLSLQAIPMPLRKYLAEHEEHTLNGTDAINLTESVEESKPSQHRKIRPLSLHSKKASVDTIDLDRKEMTSMSSHTILPNPNEQPNLDSPLTNSSFQRQLQRTFLQRRPDVVHLIDGIVKTISQQVAQQCVQEYSSTAVSEVISKFVEEMGQMHPNSTQAGDNEMDTMMKSRWTFAEVDSQRHLANLSMKKAEQIAAYRTLRTCSAVFGTREGLMEELDSDNKDRINEMDRLHLQLTSLHQVHSVAATTCRIALQRMHEQLQEDIPPIAAARAQYLMDQHRKDTFAVCSTTTTP